MKGDAMTKTDTMRGRFELAKFKALERADTVLPSDDFPSFSNGFDCGYQAAQPTEAEIEELAGEIADGNMRLVRTNQMPLSADQVASMLRGNFHEPAETGRTHDWECTAPEGGYYHWRCKNCFDSVPYPSPAEKFDYPCEPIGRPR